MQIKLLQSSNLFDCGGKPQTTKEVGCKRGLKGAQRIQQVWGGLQRGEADAGIYGVQLDVQGCKGWLLEPRKCNK